MGSSNLSPIYHGSTLLQFRDNRGIVFRFSLANLHDGYLLQFYIFNRNRIH